MMMIMMWVKVHMGVVFKITVQSNDVEAKETDTLKLNG